MARIAVRDLLESDGVEKIGVADVNFESVRQEVAKLADDRLHPMRSDVRNASELTRMMKDWDAVINTVWYELNLHVMKSAIQAGIHYVDLGGLYHMTLKQLKLASRANDAGVTCILGLGSSPGITNVMAAYGASKLTRVRTVKIRVAGGRSGSSGGFFSPPYSFRTILDEASLPAIILRNGKIQEVPALSVKESFKLPEPVGIVEGYFTLHSELATLPRTVGKGVQDMDFIVAFSPEFSRAVTLLVKLGLASREEVSLPGGRVTPYDLLTKLVDRIPRQEGGALNVGVRRVELIGERDGRKAHLIYDSISGPNRRWKVGGRALGTGIPISVGAQWLASGRVKARGVLPPEACIDPGSFLRDLDAGGRGIGTYEVSGKTNQLF